MADFGLERTALAEDMLSRRLGRKIKLSTAILKDDVSSSRASERSFWRLKVGGFAKYTDIHAKVVPLEEAKKVEARRAIALEEKLSRRGLPVADFLGSYSDEQTRVFLWENRPGRTARDFSHLTRADAERIAYAVAQISVVSQEVSGDIGLARGIKWVEPIAERVRSVLTGKHLASIERELDQFAAIEAETISRLKALEANTLTHNDVKAPNVLIDRKAITLVDWESATLGPHGASLRRFTRHGPEIENIVAWSYVRTMANQGVRLDIEDVLFVMRFQEIFWALCTGARQGRARRIVTGLRLFPELLARPF